MEDIETQIADKLTSRCFVCSMPCLVSPLGMISGKAVPIGTFRVFCSRCGEFYTSSDVSSLGLWGRLTETQVANASGYLYENQPARIDNEADAKFLVELSTPSVASKALKLLRSLAKRNQIPGATIRMTLFNIDTQVRHFMSITNGQFKGDFSAGSAALRMFPGLSMGWAQNEAELYFLVVKYLIEGVGYLERVSLTEMPDIKVRITAKGWEQLDASHVSEGKTGFVAMWFDDVMNPVWEDAFYPAIRGAGYMPLRIDKKHHNNKIDDEIIASIRGCKFVVADFTGNRGGVYYEAGFAHGLGKPVIWCVREDQLNDVHFDTRQYNHITWRLNDLASLKEQLRIRIEATIGKGSA